MSADFVWVRDPDCPPGTVYFLNPAYLDDDRRRQLAAQIKLAHQATEVATRKDEP